LAYAEADEIGDEHAIMIIRAIHGQIAAINKYYFPKEEEEGSEEGSES